MLDYWIFRRSGSTNHVDRGSRKCKYARSLGRILLVVGVSRRASCTMIAYVVFRGVRGGVCALVA